MSQYPAARVTDVFGHDAELEGVAVGVAVGALLAVGVIATGGLGALAVGAAVATTGVAGMAGAMIGKALAGPSTGQLQFGSPNVFINGLPAAIMNVASGVCSKDGASPHRVATGSATVLINGRPAARVTEKMDCGAVIRSGSPNVFIGGPSVSTACPARPNQPTTLERFRIDAQAAAAAYDPPETRKPPEGYRNATPEDLAKLRLSTAMLEHPVNKKTGQRTEFRAAVFINSQTGTALVAYKGTTPTSGQDWGTNINQGLGNHTFSYDQAQKIATNVAETPAGKGARLTGHSSGGGMASAGSEASGLPATTFNAAGLNAKTVPHPVDSQMDAVYVKGDILHASQAIPLMPRSAATRVWPLDPARSGRDPAVAAAAALAYADVGANHAVRSVLLHLMGNVEASLAQKRAGVERALAKNNCA